MYGPNSSEQVRIGPSCGKLVQLDEIGVGMPKQVGAVPKLDGKGRPGIGPGVGFCCPPTILNQVEELAGQMGVQRAEIIRRAFLVGWPEFRRNPDQKVVLSEC